MSTQQPIGDFPDPDTGAALVQKLLDQDRQIRELQDKLREVTAERNNLRLEYLWLSQREYSDNAAEAFDNRRRLAALVAKVLNVSQDERDAMRAAAVDHGGSGAEIITWLVNHWRERARVAETRLQ